MIVAHYRLDGDANDSAGTNNGTASNVSWVQGKLGQAGSFNGTTSSVVVPASTVLTMPSLHSMSCIIRINGLPASEAVIARKDIEGGGSRSLYGLRLTSTGVIEYQVFNNTINTTVYQAATPTLTTGVLYHIVGVRNSTTSLQVYVNGILVGTGSVLSSINDSTTGGVGVGKYPINNGGYFNGTIDEVMIYNRALTPTEVYNQYLLYNGIM